MSQAERLAADVGTPGGSGKKSIRRATVTSTEVNVIPDEWKGKYVRFKAKTSAIQIRFGTSASITCSLTSTSTREATGPTPPVGTLTEAGTEPHITLEAGEWIDERIDKTWTHFGHLSADTSGYLVAMLKQGRIGNET